MDIYILVQFDNDAGTESAAMAYSSRAAAEEDVRRAAAIAKECGVNYSYVVQVMGLHSAPVYPYRKSEF